MKAVILAVISALAIASAAPAQEDAEGCKDHPLFNRLSNFVIEDCMENYNAVDVHTAAETTVTKEGNVVHIRYAFNYDAGAKPPSPFQVIKNYERAVVQNGGKKIYSSTGSDGYQGATFTMSVKGVEYWVMIDGMHPGHPEVCDGFSLYVIEMKAMNQEIQASEMFDALNKQGSVALYITFETGKANIKPESQGIVDQIAQMLRDNPTLKVSVEGHTDNVGTAQFNQALSENRAKAVVDAIVAKGIERERLSWRGWGQTKPIADNATEEGRAKNRRVEIVKI